MTESRAYLCQCVLLDGAESIVVFLWWSPLLSLSLPLSCCGKDLARWQMFSGVDSKPSCRRGNGTMR